MLTSTSTELIPNTDTPTVLVSLKTESTSEPRISELTVSCTDLESAQGKRRRTMDKGILNPLRVTVALQVNLSQSSEI